MGASPPTPPLPLSKPIQKGLQLNLYAQGDATRPPINFWSGRLVKRGLVVAARVFFNYSWQGSMFWQDQMLWQESYRILKEGLVVTLARPNLPI